MAEMHRRVNNQDIRNDRHHLQIATTTEHYHRATQILFTRRPINITGPSFRARSSSGQWQRTFHTSRTKKRWQEEACHRLQQCSWHHQHSSKLPATKRQTETTKVNRRSKKEERRQVRRIQGSLRQRFPKGNRGPLSLLIAVNHHGSRKDNREHHPSYNQCHDTLPRHEGKTV